MKKNSSIIYSLVALAAVMAYCGFLIKGGIKSVNSTEETLPYLGKAAASPTQEIIGSQAAEELFDEISLVPVSNPQSVPIEPTEAETVPVYVFSPIFPLSGEISKTFSADLKYNENTHDWRSHSGIDITAAKTARVLAAETGVVTKCFEDPLWGNTIEIDHGEYKSVYKNLSTLQMVSEGKTVQKGDPISGVGDSAPSEKILGAHLHFEIIKDSSPIDPLLLLDKSSL